MRSFIGALLILAATSASAAQTSVTALCDSIASQIRAVPTGDPWALLTKAEHPYIDLRSVSETKALLENGRDNAELVAVFTAKFNPTNELRNAWANTLENGHVEVGSLPDSDLHVVTNTDGSALCLSFLFFQTTKGRPAQLLPDLPKKSDRDGENLICNKTGGDGYFARVGGVEAFVETYDSDAGGYLRVVPLRNGKWDSACTVDVDYRTNYKASKVFVPAKGLLTETDLRSLAPQIVEQREGVKEAKDFSFGPPLSSRETEEVRTMTELLAKMAEERVPAFGKESDLDAGEDKLVSGDSFGTVLNGRAYLLRLGAGQLGCCYFPGPILILYSLKDGKLEPAGSAIVEKSRGAIKSVRSK